MTDESSEVETPQSTPVVALVGRPNVGKSTLFNRLTKTRDAIVADFPGLTRDRKYGIARVGQWPFIVVDTGGLIDSENELEHEMAAQTWQAVEEANVVFFMVDGRSGVSAGDELIAQQLRRAQKKVVLVVNKIDGVGEEMASADFYSLGFGEPQSIAAVHNRGVTRLVEQVAEEQSWRSEEDASNERLEEKRIRVAVVGRPNVGKSTLINRFLGEERLVASDLPGTTRDSVEVAFERNGQAFTLVDTAGVRRRGKVKETVEKFSVIKTLQSIDDAHVAILVLNGQETITEQDLSLLSYVVEKGRALIIAINKWDGLSTGQRERVKRDLLRRLEFLQFTKPRFISALHGTGVGDLLGLVTRGYESAMRDLSASQLTRILEDAVMQHQPPMVRGRRVKLRYAHQGGSNPPIIVIHGNQTERVPDAYRRYLTNTFCKVLKISGTPVRVEFKTGDNPFKGRRNTLTPRQMYKRKRMINHYSKK